MTQQFDCVLTSGSLGQLLLAGRAQKRTRSWSATAPGDQLWRKLMVSLRREHADGRQPLGRVPNAKGAWSRFLLWFALTSSLTREPVGLARCLT